MIGVVVGHRHARAVSEHHADPPVGRIIHKRGDRALRVDEVRKPRGGVANIGEGLAVGRDHRGPVARRVPGVGHGLSGGIRDRQRLVGRIVGLGGRPGAVGHRVAVSGGIVGLRDTRRAVAVLPPGKLTRGVADVAREHASGIQPPSLPDGRPAARQFPDEAASRGLRSRNLRIGL